MTPDQIRKIRFNIPTPRKGYLMHHATQSELAALLQQSPQTIAAWETGRRKPNGAAKVLLQLLATNPALAAEISNIDFQTALLYAGNNKTS